MVLVMWRVCPSTRILGKCFNCFLLVCKIHPGQGNQKCNCACTGFGALTGEKLPKVVLSNSMSCRLEKQFVQLARRGSSRQCKELGDTVILEVTATILLMRTLQGPLSVHLKEY